jgi:hypothetical protein
LAYLEQDRERDRHRNQERDMNRDRDRDEDRNRDRDRDRDRERLREILARQAQQALPIFDLQTLSGMDPQRYAGTLKELRGEGHIVIEGEAPEQMVRLTASGADAVRPARPA